MEEPGGLLSMQSQELDMTEWLSVLLMYNRRPNLWVGQGHIQDGQGKDSACWVNNLTIKSTAECMTNVS